MPDLELKRHQAGLTLPVTSDQSRTPASTERLTPIQFPSGLLFISSALALKMPSTTSLRRKEDTRRSVTTKSGFT